ncbi:hypothetical protein [Streptomyces sp. NPDC048392]
MNCYSSGSALGATGTLWIGVAGMTLGALATIAGMYGVVVSSHESLT